MGVLTDNPRDPDIWYLYVYDARGYWKLIAGTGIEHLGIWLFQQRIATYRQTPTRLMHGDEIVAQSGEAPHPG